MAREGTRSQTGHAAPRIFRAIDTAPAIVRKKATKAKIKTKAKTTKVAAAIMPAGVAKNKKKEPTAASKVKALGKKVVRKAAAKKKA